MPSTAGPFSTLPQVPEDPMFGLSAAFRADQYPQKVDLGVGAYRDDGARPWILPSVKKADQLLLSDATRNHEYLPIAGLDEYITSSQALIFGTSSSAILQARIASVQTLSGTGALHLAALLLSQHCSEPSSRIVHVSNPPYVNHLPILHHVNLPTARYPYYSPSSHGLDIDGFLTYLRQTPSRSTILLHACGHNPTGVDPTQDQWKQIADVMESKQHIPFFDSAYQGFVSGDPDADAWPIRHFVEQGFDTVLVAQSYAKNFGLYGERVGCLHVVTSNAELATRMLGQLKRLQRVEISTPPAYGARLVGTILKDPLLFVTWKRDVKSMADRIKGMRAELRRLLEENGTPGSWNHLTDQSGMFCFSGLAEWQIERLRREYHIYTTKDARMSIAGLNSRNVGYVAAAIKAVVSEQRILGRL